MDYIEIVVTGWEAKAAKPSPKILRKAVEMLGTTPKETVLVSDNETINIRPARQLGIYTILIDREDTIRRHTTDVKIKSLMQLPECLFAE